MEMLINGKSEEIAKYSKLNYVPDKFIKMCRMVWEYSDLQIRCIYLISDLAKRGNGVFSIAYSSFQKMFQQRFKTEISLSTVRRFFGLMEKLGLLSKNEAKRKNEQQSANIYIIEAQLEETTEVAKKEHPSENPSEHQNISKEIDVKQKPLTNDTSVNKNVDKENAINDLFIEFASKGISKTLFFKVLKEIEKNRSIKNFKAYLRGTLNKVVYHREFKAGNIEFKSTNPVFFNWLQE